MEQPLAISPTSPTREERELQASRPYGTPLVDLKQLLEGDVPQDKMTCLIFIEKKKPLEAIRLGGDPMKKKKPLWFGGLEFSQRLPLCVS